MWLGQQFIYSINIIVWAILKVQCSGFKFVSYPVPTSEFRFYRNLFWSSRQIWLLLPSPLSKQILLSFLMAKYILLPSKVTYSVGWRGKFDPNSTKNRLNFPYETITSVFPASEFLFLRIVTFFLLIVTLIPFQA